MEVLKQCPLAIAQRLVHCTIAVSTAVLGRVTKTMLLKKCTLYSLVVHGSNASLTCSLADGVRRPRLSPLNPGQMGTYLVQASLFSQG